MKRTTIGLVMKSSLSLVSILTLLLIATTVFGAQPGDTGLASAQGADLFRGAWGGEIQTNAEAIQINLYFNESVPDVDDPNSVKAAGYFSWDEPGGQKRAKAPILPMMAKITDLGSGIYELFILANVMIPGDEESTTTVAKLTGNAEMGGSGVTDDKMTGEWYVMGPDGTLIEGPWSASHLDRRAVEAPEVDLDDPTLNLFFYVDAYACLNGPATLPPAERDACTILGVWSNIVMDDVRVTLPDGTSLILPKYSDVFSPGVDWTTLFRFSDCEPGMPVVGGTYTFTALDVAGNPIPGVESTDVWVGVEAPDPPTNVTALETDDGILVTWDDVPVILGSFEPAGDPQLGFYQLEVYSIKPEPWEGEEVYGANHIAIPEHLIPKDKADFIEGKDWGLSLNEMEDGDYVLETRVHSAAPEGSDGHGWEYNNSDPGQNIFFTIEDGVITLLEETPPGE